MQRINLVLDFDGVINNEPFATIKSFANVLRKMRSKYSAEEAYIILKHIDETQGHLEYDEIVKNVFKSIGIGDSKLDLCLKLFNDGYKSAPNKELICMLDQYKDILNVIIFSRNNEKTIRGFLVKYEIERYFDRIYCKQKKYLTGTFKELIKSEKLRKENTLFVGDEIYDIYIPKLLGFRWLFFNHFFSNFELHKAILAKLYETNYDEIANLW